MSLERPNGGGKGGGKSSAATAKGAARTALLRGKAGKGFHYKGGGVKRSLGALAALGFGMMTLMMYMRAGRDREEAYPANLDFEYFEAMYHEVSDRYLSLVDTGATRSVADVLWHQPDRRVSCGARRHDWALGPQGHGGSSDELVP